MEQKVVETKKQKKERLKKMKPGRLAKREARMGYVFILPWVIGALIFLIVPLCQSFYYALCKSKFKPGGVEFTYLGQENYMKVFADVDFLTALSNYIVTTIISAPVIVVFALIIAMLLNGKIKCRGLFRLIYFLPVIVVSGPVMNMLSGNGATTISSIDATLIQSFLQDFVPSGMAETIATTFGNMTQTLWYSGVQILIFLSALQKINPSLYEAAKIDGGSSWECFWKITLPTIKPMILLNVVYSIVYMSNNEQNEIINSIQSTMFMASKGYGYASAMAWMYSIVETLIVVIFAVVLMTRKDVYQKQVKKAKKEAKKQAKLLKKVQRREMKHEAKTAKATKA